jgi:hypothetical protein
MVVQGTVTNGVVVLEPGAQIPDGTRVDVTVPAELEPATPTGRMLLRHAGKAKGLPPDMAVNHDHYLHGMPKREDRREG